MNNLYVFLFRQPDPPSGYYYVVEESLDTVMASCGYIGSMVYMGHIPLSQVADTINEIPIPKEHGSGYFDPLSDVVNPRFAIPPCRSCTNRICGKPPESRPLQGMYCRRKLSRYPGKAGEENDDDR